MPLLRCLTRIRPGCLIKCLRRYSSVSTNELHGERAKGAELPKDAKVVVCGGGVMGASVAYHLADLGVKDIVLLEQGKITCGTTWHSVGLIGQVGRDDVTNCKLMQYSKNLYKNFETLGEYVGWKECGSLLLARTKDRMTMLKKKRDIAIWVRTDDLEGGLYIPSDGALTAPDVNVAFINLAKRKGVQVFEGVGVNRVVSSKGRVSGVETTHGKIDCQSFVNCSGMWARDLGRKTDPQVNIPLHACEHFYIATTPIQGMDPMLPVIRDYDGLVYFREWSGGIMAGGFEPVAKPTFQHGVPSDFQFQLLQDDWDHFQILLDAIVHRIPAMETANVQKMFNGPESFTPDGNWLIGECPELQNYFVAAGMGGTGIVSAGGVGKHLAEWVLTGQPSPGK
ncbi:hypothetical protein FSP39_010084 [Pinctada imbricata]|uniref:Rhodanese domain-containing protein n=1 Tax=Pinctada imbricata TaxID=66713 RepID=A0AA89BSL6_PINIB|nr:hypothetical protein FSP39_010084 [Pinctada imbricata]